MELSLYEGVAKPARRKLVLLMVTVGILLLTSTGGAEHRSRPEKSKPREQSNQPWEGGNDGSVSKELATQE